MVDVVAAAEEAPLLAGEGDEDHAAVRLRRALGQGAGDLQHRGHARGVVVGPVIDLPLLRCPRFRVPMAQMIVMRPQRRSFRRPAGPRRAIRPTTFLTAQGIWRMSVRPRIRQPPSSRLMAAPGSGRFRSSILARVGPQAACQHAVDHRPAACAAPAGRRWARVAPAKRKGNRGSSCAGRRADLGPVVAGRSRPPPRARRRCMPCGATSV